MNDDIYAWTRFLRTPDVTLETTYANDETKEFTHAYTANMVMSSTNMDYLTDMILARADPLRNGVAVGARDGVRTRVEQLLTSWKNLGKFDQITIPFEGKTMLVNTVSPVALLDAWNMQFMDAFAETILPASDITNVTSVVNPNGLFAQQERILRVNSKPVPFYERALYRRLTDRNLDQRIDETEHPFYKMDANPHLSDEERKKTDRDAMLPTYLDREGMSFRMLPKY